MIPNAKDGYLINDRGILFVYSDVLAKRHDMRRARQEEIDRILGAKSPSVVSDVPAKEEGQPEPAKIGSDNNAEITDSMVNDYATLHGIENDKAAINAFCLERHGETISKIYSTTNMVREVMKLEK